MDLFLKTSEDQYPGLRCGLGSTSMRAQRSNVCSSPHRDRAQPLAGGGVVVAANYNCPGQLVISGDINAINAACETLKTEGARRALVLPVGGAFHSPLMEPARADLASAIESTNFNSPICSIYQNVTAQAENDPSVIKANLIAQLTAPVKWTQSMKAMISAGANQAVEVGPGKVLQGLFKKVDRAFDTSSAAL